jgi:uncharacterized protein YuzE
MAASINLKELIDIIRDHPKYKDQWEAGDPLHQGFYIELQAPDQSREQLHVKSEVFLTPDGGEIAIDIDKEGKVWGIEVI